MTRITTRDLAIITDVAKFQLLTTKQIAPRHFPSATVNAASNRLNELTRAGFLHRVYSYPRATNDSANGRPSAIYLFPPKCQSKVQEKLEATGQASAFDDLADYTKSYNSAQTFAQQSLEHELGLSDVFLALENAVQSIPTASIAFWERTSPRHKDLTDKFKVSIKSRKTGKVIERTVSFNPDGFLALIVEKKLAFFFVEYDNDTSKVAKVAEKNAAYMKYNDTGKMRTAADIFCRRHGLGVTLPEKVGFRVLTVTPSTKRAGDLFIDSTMTHPKKMFYYTSREQATTDPLGAIWLRKHEFGDNAAAYYNMQDTKPSVRRTWLADTISQTNRVSLLNS